jgi:muramidase (phage lysozyme)
MFECVRWREGGDTADQPNGAGMYQFTNRATWDEFRGRFPQVPSEATPLEQDIVAYRAWRTEQFLPWNGDPCLGAVHEYGRWGWY